jgi:WD40 repeat protein
MRWGTYCRFFGHGQDVIDLSWNRNALYLASASMDGTVKFWSLDKKK